jgi:hypothetical protein
LMTGSPGGANHSSTASILTMFAEC